MPPNPTELSAGARAGGCLSFYHLFLFGIAYSLAAAAGEWLDLVPGFRATFWPPSGLYVAVLLQAHRRDWPRLIATALPAELAITLWFYELGLLFSVFVFAAHTMAAVCGALLVLSWCGTPFRCQGLREVLGLTLLAGILSPALSATLGALTLALARVDSFSEIWLLWWIADAVGVLIVAPLVTILIQRRVFWRDVSAARWSEAAALLVTLVTVTHVIFSARFPLAYLALPPLLWAALRFGMPGAVLAMTVMTVMAVQYTDSGAGVFADPAFSLSERALLVQSYLGTIGVSTLVLAALINQRQSAQRALQRGLDELEDRVVERTHALRASEERLQLALEAAHAGTWEGDLTRGVFTASERALSLPGVAPGEPIGHEQLLALVHPQDQAHLISAFRRTAAIGAPLKVELRVLQGDGTVRWLAAHAELRTGPAGQRMIGLLQDITERKQAEEALRLREREFRDMFELAGVGKTQVDPVTCRFRRANARFCAMLGYSEQELMAKTFLDVTHPEDRQLTIERTAAFLRGDVDSYSNEKRYIRKDGETVWVIITGKMVRDSHGRPLYALSDTQDITERKRTETALRESEERLRLALEAARAGTWDVDLVTGLVTRDATTHAILELPPKSGEGQAEFFNALLPEDRERLIAVRRRAIAEGSEYAGEFRVVRPDGRLVWVMNKGKPFYNSSGEPIRLVGICMDISERKKIEQELERTVAELQAVDRQKDDFLALLSHEMRNPLAPVLNAVQILRMRGHHDDETVWCTDIIDRQVRQMARLLDDLLDVSRITRGKLELRKHAVELAPLIEMAVETSRPLIDAGRHQLALNLGAEPIIIDADGARIAQVIANLLNNAAKYSEPGGRIRVDVGTETSAADGARSREVVIRVADTGIGIPADKLPQIFDPFVQIDGTSDKTHGGLGIGLALAKRLIEMHGGSIAAASDGPGKGSCFSVRLPILDLPQPAAAQQNPGRKVPARRKVLVVDDSKINADSLGMLLEIAGNEVTTAYSGPEALEKAAALRPDIILMDLSMPGMDGYETARHMRERLKHRKLVMIAISGWGPKDVRLRAIGSGFDAYVTKPVDFPDLEKLMARLAD